MTFSSLAGHIVELAERIEQNNQPADRIVGDFLRSRKYLGSHDRRFISEAIYGMVRHRRRIAVLAQQFLTEHPPVGKPLPLQASFLAQFVAYAAGIEEMDPQQLINQLQKRWTESLPTVDLSHFIYWLARNKSLNFLQGDDIRQLADWYSFEEWMVKEWVEQFGQDEAEDLLHALDSEAPITMRVNTLKIRREDCAKRLATEGLETVPTKYSPRGLIAKKRFTVQSSAAFKEGLFEVQDEGSQIICQIIQPQPGGLIIDACAGAGGKSLAMAELMRNQGEILAFDVDARRLRELENRATRNGIHIIMAKKPDTIHPGDLLGKADAVLVDAPCSGVGTIRRSPWLKWSVDETMVKDYVKQQHEILESNASYVRRGGRLVYVTCSLFRKENEEIMQKFLTRYDKFLPMPPVAELSTLGIDPAGLFVKLLPHRHGTDGFFVAVLERKA